MENFISSKDIRVNMQYQKQKSLAVFEVSGEIDHHSARRIREEIDHEIIIKRPATVRLDFGNVNFMDSAGLGLILGRYTRVSEYGGELIIMNPPPGVVKLMKLSGTDKLIRSEYDNKEKDLDREDLKNEKHG